MKLYQIISIAFTVSMLFIGSSMANPLGDVEETSFEVKGVCEMCKERIENAALIKAVKWVEWDKATDTLTVIYRKDKLDIIKVHNSIAEAGHTTEKVKCNIEAYNKLPACCAYMGDVEKH